MTKQDLLTALEEAAKSLEAINAMAGLNEAPTSFKHVWRAAVITAQNVEADLKRLAKDVRKGSK
jgi:hypothetical protein